MIVQLIAILHLLVSTKGSDVAPRIIGGSDATFGEFPQTVAIRQSGSFVGAGTVIHPLIILTTGQTVTTAIEFYTVEYNATTITPGPDAPFVAQVEEFIRHPDYTVAPSGAIMNDIGLLVLKEPLALDLFVQRVQLPQFQAPTPAYHTATLVGWGDIDTEGGTTNTLQKADIIVYSDTDCESLLAMGPANSTINVCAGLPEGGVGVCVGDGGGPLFVEGVQIGIASWIVRPCARPEVPAAFTKVSNYVNWVEKMMVKVEEKYQNKGL